MSRPVVAYVAHRLDPGGTERLVVDMALAMRDEFDTVVFTLDGPGSWAATLLEAGVPVRSLDRRPGIDLAVPPRLASALRESRADLVHAHQCSPWFYAALARVLNRRPRLLLQEHGRFWPERDAPARRMVNRLAVTPMTDRFVAVSLDIADRLARYEGVPARRIEVIHNGIAMRPAVGADERRALRAMLGIDDGFVLIGTVGRLDPIKNLPMLLDALAPISAADPRVRCVVIGDGPERDALVARATALGLGERVRFLGHREDARRLVSCLDAFVLCSYSEGVSVALLEAMSAGVAPIVTAVGGNLEVVEDGACGWCVPSDDVPALIEALGDLVRRPDERERRATAARARAAEHFSWSGMLDAYRALYRTMLAGRWHASSSGPSGVAQ